MKFHSRWAVAALSVIVLGASSIVHAAGVSGQGTWETTLQGRDLDGNLSTAEAYYDTALNITWLANSNYAASWMFWTEANAWAASLNPYGSGITGWRLPNTVDVGNDGCTYTNFYQGVDCGYNITTLSEMSHMFYVTLGDKAYYNTSGEGPQPGSGLTNAGPFFIDTTFLYYSATEYAPDTMNAWYFRFGSDITAGAQAFAGKDSGAYAWAVHSGDVGASVSSVPVPAAVWLFGSGLAGLFGFARKKISA